MVADIHLASREILLFVSKRDHAECAVKPVTVRRQHPGDLRQCDNPGQVVGGSGGDIVAVQMAAGYDDFVVYRRGTHFTYHIGAEGPCPGFACRVDADYSVLRRAAGTAADQLLSGVFGHRDNGDRPMAGVLDVRKIAGAADVDHRGGAGGLRQADPFLRHFILTAPEIVGPVHQHDGVFQPVAGTLKLTEPERSGVYQRSFDGPGGGVDHLYRVIADFSRMDQFYGRSPRDPPVDLHRFLMNLHSIYGLPLSRQILPALLHVVGSRRPGSDFPAEGFHQPVCVRAGLNHFIDVRKQLLFGL